MAKQKINFTEMGKRAAETGHQLAAQDRENEQAIVASRTEIPMELILKRPGGDTRPIDALHVLGLAESISAIGLLEPVVVDCKHRLVAGAHRLAALRLLAAEDRISEFARYSNGSPANMELSERLKDLRNGNAEDWSLVPVHRLEFDAELDATTALAAEVAENERRRDYNKQEIKMLAERLKAAGFKSSRGRPKIGERSLIPALEVIVGKSRATLMRVLAGDDAPTEPNLNSSDETFIRSIERLRTSASKAAGLGSKQEDSIVVVEKLQNILQLIEEIVALWEKTK